MNPSLSIFLYVYNIAKSVVNRSTKYPIIFHFYETEKTQKKNHNMFIINKIVSLYNRIT